MNPVKKLSEIRSLVTSEHVAKEFGVSRDHVTRILHGRTTNYGTKAQQEKARKLLKEIVEVALEGLSF